MPISKHPLALCELAMVDRSLSWFARAHSQTVGYAWCIKQEFAMIGYKVLCQDGLKGPFKKSSILKAISSAIVPLQARLFELHTGRYVLAAELVGEHIDHTEAAPQLNKTKVDTLKKLAEQPLPAPLKLAEESPAQVEETPRIVLLGKIPLKKARMPRPRKLAEVHA
jgi:hypothetical protein